MRLRINRGSLFAAAAFGLLAVSYRNRKARGPWAVHEVLVESTEGIKLRGFLRLPDGPGPHPAVVFLHGGRGGSPVRASVMARTRVAAGLLAAGYAVLSAGYRRHAWMCGEVDDALAAFQFLATHPHIDANRLAILGNSHGGSIAIAAGLKTNARCVVEYCGVTEAEAMVRFLRASPLSRTPLIREALDDLRKMAGGSLDECPQVYRAMSPATLVRDLKCPLMIVHGSQDAVVPVTHAYILRDALEAAGLPYEMHIFPRMPHSFTFQNRAEARDAIARTIAFLDRHTA